MRKLRPLNQTVFILTIIKDLGMCYQTSTSKKRVRQALFQCTVCKKPFKATISNIQARPNATCSQICAHGLSVLPKDLTQELLKTLFHYNSETGVFTRKLKWAVRQTLGEVVGVKTGNGYLKTSINDKEYFLHRLAVLYMTGSFPAEDTDHINHKRDDNRWINLREVSHVVNHQNLAISARNTSGIVGVSYDTVKGLWKAEILANNHQLQRKFKTKFGAIRQRVLWNREFKFHPNHGRKEPFS